MPINNPINPVVPKVAPRAVPGLKKVSPIKRYSPPPRRVPKPGGSGLLILVVILILILLGVLTLIFLVPPRLDDKNVTPDNVKDYSVPMNTDLDSSAQQQQDPTADWLTYDKASTTYLFKYPTNWILREQGSSLVLSLPTPTSSEITFGVSTSTKSLTDYLAELDKIHATSYEGKPSVQVQSSTPLTSGEIKGVQRRQTLLAADLEQDIIYLSYSNKLFTIALNSPKITPELESAFGLFLATLKLVPVASTGTQAVNVSSTASTSPALTSSTTSYLNAKFKFQLDYPSSSTPSKSSDGIIFTIGKYKLTIVGIKGVIPSLVKYQPNGAKIAGQTTIAGVDAVKLLASKPTNSDSPYIQYIVPIDDNNWIKIEYFGKEDVAKSFEAIIATLKFIK